MNLPEATEVRKIFLPGSIKENVPMTGDFTSCIKKIELSKETMEKALDAFLDGIFALPEIESAKVRDVIITRKDRESTVRKAFEAGWHDSYSDVDLSVKVRLPKDGLVTPEAYVKRIDRFGVTQESALGYCFVPENCMYRIIYVQLRWLMTNWQ